MTYHAPGSFAEAAAIAAEAAGTVRFLAGGTDVLVQMRSDIVTPDVLIDVKRIDGAQGIMRQPDGGWRIGAATPGLAIWEHEEFRADWPGIAEAMNLVGSTQVRGRATLVGNLCNASPAADTVPAMVAADAAVEITDAQGNTRTMKVRDVPAGPGRTNLARGEVVSAVLIPPRGAGGGDAYLRFIPRTEMDIAVVGCGISLRREGDTITEARVALGAVAPTVVLVEAAAEALIGSTLDDAAIAALEEAARAACRPIDDKRGTVEFRIHVAGVLARRVAKIAYERAGG